MTRGERGPDLDEVGTPEAAWSSCGLQQLPELAIPDYRHAVIVAPHPDDEVLGSAGLMQRLSSRGIPLTIVGVTDGEASHPRSPTVGPRALAERRARERHQALNLLGLGGAAVLSMALADGAVARDAGELAACLTDLLGPDVLCVAPSDHDGHPDHDAAGRAAAMACAATGATFLRYLVWTWHWATPGDARVPWLRGRRLDLSAFERTRKRSATAAFRSQVAPLSDGTGDEAILAPEMLAYFERPFEVFLA